MTYCNDPKFLANSADPGQTAPRAVWSGSSLFAIPFASSRGIRPWYNLFVWLLECLQQRFLASQNLGTLYIQEANQSGSPDWSKPFLLLFGKSRFTIKFLNLRTPKIFAVSYLELEQRGQTFKLFCQNGAKGIANSKDSDQTAPLEAVWSGSALFAQKLRVITVLLVYSWPGSCFLQPFYYLSLVVRKPVFGVFDQVRYKPGWVNTEDG